MTLTHTLSELQRAPIAHTNKGDFLFVGGAPENEFIVFGKIIKIQAGLFFLDIEGNKFTTHKQEGFEVGEHIHCIVVPIIKEEGIKFTIRSLKKIN